MQCNKHLFYPDKIIVSYPIKQGEETITRAEYDLIRYLGKDQFIQSIKFLRGQYKFDLYTAKHMVDSILDTTSIY